MSDDDLRAALERLLASAPSDTDETTVRSAMLAGHLVVGNRNVTAGRDITGNTITIGDTVVQVASAEAMTTLLNRLFPHRVNTLPPAPADFTGRQTELALILQHAESSGATITGIRGLGGVGKTALALVVAHQIAPRYPDAALYLNLQGASDSPLDVRDAQASVIRAFHPTATIPEDPDQLAALYSHTPSDKSGVLLLDDARDASQVRPLLPPARWALLVTSRQHFSLPGILPLDLPELPMDDSRALLQAIATRLTDAEADEIAALCGHLPLALRLAAGAIQNRPALSPADYIRRLRDERNRIALLDSSLQLDPDQLGIEASLQISCDLLPDNLRAVWPALALFVESFDPLAVAAILNLLPDGPEVSNDQIQLSVDKSTDLMDALSQFSLLESDQPGRYRFHELARLFANRQLTNDQRNDSALRHSMHYASALRAAQHRLGLGGKEILLGLRIVDLDWANIRAGQRWAASHGMNDERVAGLVVDYAVPAAHVLDLRLHPREQIAWLEAALSVTQHFGDRLGEGSILGNLGTAHSALSDFPRAIDFFQQSMAVAHELGNQNGKAGAIINIGNAYISLGDAAQAAHHFLQALTIMQSIGDRRGEQAAMLGLGTAAANLGDFRQAIDSYSRALVIAQEDGDQRGEAGAFGSLGNAYLTLGELDGAAGYYHHALRLLREIGDRRQEAAVLAGLGNVFTANRDLDLAVRCHEQALEIAREIGDYLGEGYCLGNLGSIYLAQGQFKPAVSLFDRALSIMRETRDRRSEGISLVNLGKAYSGLGKWESALSHHARALAIMREVRDDRGVGNVLANIANTLGKSGDWAAAIATADQALSVLDPLQDPDCGRIRRQIQGWREQLARVSDSNP